MNQGSVVGLSLLLTATCGCGLLLPESRQCGGLAGFACLPWEYCHFADGSCGAADQTGICDRRPQVCPEIFAPVCGCDGETYGNECEAAGNGVSVASQGECGEAEERCRSQCEVPGFPCEERPLSSFEDYDQTASAWVEDLEGLEPFDLDEDGIADVPFVYGGACGNGIIFLFSGHGFGGHLYFFHAQSAGFVGMVNQTDILAGDCWGLTFWPERIDCPQPIVTYVYIGENHVPGDAITLVEPP